MTQRQNLHYSLSQNWAVSETPSWPLLWPRPPPWARKSSRIWQFGVCRWKGPKVWRHQAPHCTDGMTEALRDSVFDPSSNKQRGPRFSDPKFKVLPTVARPSFSFLESGICHWPQAAWCGSCPLKGSMHQGWEPKAPNSRATVSLQTRKGSPRLHPPLSSPQATASFPSRHTWQLTLHLSPQLHSCFVPRHFPKGPSRGSL